MRNRGGESRAFILPVALAVASLIAVVVIFSAGLVRRSLAAPQKNMALARAQALYGLDVALAQLQAVTASDTVATASASILGNVVNPSWVGAWAQGAASPVWLVSGSNPSPYVTESTQITDTLRAPLINTSQGSYAYVVQDNSMKLLSKKSDNLDSLSPAFGDNATRLRQQSIFVPQTALLSSTDLTPMSYGLLTNPISGGFKIDFDTNASNPNADAMTLAVNNWRDDPTKTGSTQFIQSRPLIWAQVSLPMGIYRDGAGTPQLGLCFLANAWNPYTLMLPFNSKRNPDLRLRIQGPTGTAKYYNAAGSLVGFETIDISSHTSSNPIKTDLYGPMNPGEIRYITHYRLAPISSNQYPDSTSVEVNFPSGNWSFIFETLDGKPIQTLSGFSTNAFNKRFGYGTMTTGILSPSTAQWILGFKINSDIKTMMTLVDPRSPNISYSSKYYYNDPDPIHAQSNYVSIESSGIYHGGQVSKVFDLPEGSLVSAGSLYQMMQPSALPLTLGSSSAGAFNKVFDQYFFSTLPVSDAIWTPAQNLPLPNSNLRVTSANNLSTLSTNPVQHLLVRGAFNINTDNWIYWADILPTDRSAFQFRSDATAQTSQINTVQRAAWAQTIVERLHSRGKPWGSISELASEDILPPDVFCRTSALLQPRGDTFTVFVYASSSGSAASLQALVQRLPTTDGNGRKFQILSLKWVSPHAQN
jgi:hypothetical protein